MTLALSVWRKIYTNQNLGPYFDESLDEEGRAKDKGQGHLVHHPLLVAHLGQSLKPYDVLVIGQGSNTYII